MREISHSELLRLQAMSSYELKLKSEGFRLIAGVDEVGRGPLAGPVVASACILLNDVLFANLNDSKKLTPAKRDILFEELTTCSDVIYAIGIVDVETIDRVNILQATFLAMQQAVAALPIQPDCLLIDGNQLPTFDIPAKGIVQGDGLSISIAAASIIAKVTRDRIMEQMDALWPQYGFKQHKGYGTKTHIAALEQHGPSPHHRKSFSVSTFEFS